MAQVTHDQSGFLRQSRHSRPGLALVIGLHGVAIALALLAKSGVIPIDQTTGIIRTYTVPITPPPDPIESVEPQAELPHTPTVTDPVFEVPEPRFAPVDPPPLPSDPIPSAPVPDPTPAPVFEGATFTHSALASLQPRYPSNLLRQELEGSCTIRVRIAPSGRVTAAEPVRATHPAFCEATQRHALRRWRFEPATRDGVPVESWQRHVVEFRIT